MTSCDAVLSSLVTVHVYTLASDSDTSASTNVLCTVYGSIDAEVSSMMALLKYHVIDGIGLPYPLQYSCTVSCSIATVSTDILAI